MKIIIEKHEWQLLGQLAIEAGEGKHAKGIALPAVLLWEFYRDNAAAFQWPQRRRRSLRFSTVLGIQKYLSAQKSRNDALWDVTLMNLTSKVTAALLAEVKQTEHDHV